MIRKDELTQCGCKTEVKLAKSGYVVSYNLNKKTIANYVFRKKGLMARIYASHISHYMEVLGTLPDGMAQTILEAPMCKRLLDPSACNPRCSIGYDFILKGNRLQKCRNSAFMFLVSEENKPFIKAHIPQRSQSPRTDTTRHIMRIYPVCPPFRAVPPRR